MSEGQLSGFSLIFNSKKNMRISEKIIEWQEKQWRIAEEAKAEAYKEAWYAVATAGWNAPYEWENDPTDPRHASHYPKQEKCVCGCTYTMHYHDDKCPACEDQSEPVRGASGPTWEETQEAEAEHARYFENKTP